MTHGSRSWSLAAAMLPALLTALAAPPTAAQTAAAPAYTVPHGPEPAAVELGSLAAADAYKLKVGLERGAVYYAHLTDYLYTALADPEDPNNHYLMLAKFQDVGPDGSPTGGWIRPLAARTIVIDDAPVDLTGAAWSLDNVLRDAGGVPHAAIYSLTVRDGDDQPVVTITRHYELAVNSYQLICRQSIRNHTTRPLEIRWEQIGQADAPVDAERYMGDRRLVVAGYINRRYNPTESIIFVDDTFKLRTSVLKGEAFFPVEKLAEDPSHVSLAWVAMLNRYFAVALHRPVRIEPDQKPDATAVPNLQELFPTTRMLTLGRKGDDAGDDARRLVTLLTSRPLTIEPEATADLSLVLFAGPRKSELFKQPVYQALFFQDLIRYDLGGMCAFCTFQWLAHLLLGFMKLIHAVTFDWGVAIIVLVVVVRAILHPITKKSQIQMTRFSKQMQAMKPELDKLKLRYASDPRKLQTEQAKMMRERGLNPVNMLGCLPMFLQMPIWIALYSMLFFAIELRHESAFWGVFQAVSDGRWAFLADLSSPDRFIRFAEQPIRINFPLLNALDLSTLNILPLLMGVAMFLQQRFMAQPAANEQQEQMQRMMSFMLLLFPVFLYAAPSGLTLYILASTGAGMLDSYLVRRHIKREEEAGTLLTAKGPKPGSLRDRMSKWAAARQAEIEARQHHLDGGKGQHRYRDRRDKR